MCCRLAIFFTLKCRHPTEVMNHLSTTIIVLVASITFSYSQPTDSTRIDFSREANMDVSHYIKTFPEVSQQADRFRRFFRVGSNIPFVLGPADIIPMQALMRDVHHTAAEQLQNMQACRGKKCITAVRISYGLDLAASAMKLLYQPVVLVQERDSDSFKPKEITKSFLEYDASAAAFIETNAAREWILSYQQNTLIDKKGRGNSFATFDKEKDTQSIIFAFQELVEYYYSIFPDADTKFRNSLYIHNGATLHEQPGTTRKLPRHTLFFTYYDFGFAGRDGGLLGPAADAGYLCPTNCDALEMVLEKK